MAWFGDLLGRIGMEFLDGVVVSLPRILVGLAFLLGAYVGIKLLLGIIRRALKRIYPAEEKLVVDLLVMLVGVFMWFGVGLVFLNIIGMGEIAASLGTAAGFIALGISYALSEMIEDTVAGVYLLRDPDFNVGDHIEADSVTGTVAEIGLRKSRINTADGDRVVVANRDIESRWRRDVPESTRTDSA